MAIIYLRQYRRTHTAIHKWRERWRCTHARTHTNTWVLCNLQKVSPTNNENNRITINHHHREMKHTLNIAQKLSLGGKGAHSFPFPSPTLPFPSHSLTHSLSRSLKLDWNQMLLAAVTTVVLYVTHFFLAAWQKKKSSSRKKKRNSRVIWTAVTEGRAYGMCIIYKLAHKCRKRRNFSWFLSASVSTHV